MSYASVLATVNMYTSEADDLTYQLGDITMQITKAAGKTSALATNATNQRAAIKAEADEDPDYADSTEYKEDLQDVQDEYNMKLADINSWEKELELKKTNMETRIQAIKSYKESYMAVLKENVKNDSNFTQISGS